MKKKNTVLKTALFAAAFMIFGYTQLNGQIFKVGDKDLNITGGIGTPWVFRNDYNTVLPPVAISLDYGYRDDIGPGILSIGGMLAATTYRTGWAHAYGYKSTTGIIALRGTYHYELIDKLDTYGGVHIGGRVERWVEYGDIPYGFSPYDNFRIRPIFSIFGGAKYYFSDKIAAMAEIGYSIAFINLGVCIKL